MPKNTASYFVAQCLRSSILQEQIIVSFADTEQGHKGTIYQALNFIYAGQTRPTSEYSIKGSQRHNTTISKGKTVKELKIEHGEDFSYKKRSIKHRYVYFRNNQLKSKLLLKKQTYPK
jgi:hypothetical protein